VTSEEEGPNASKRRRIAAQSNVESSELSELSATTPAGDTLEDSSEDDGPSEKKQMREPRTSAKSGATRKSIGRKGTSDSSDDEVKDVKSTGKANGRSNIQAREDDSGSEMSVLIDDEPMAKMKKNRPKPASAAAKKSSAKAKVTKTRKDTATLDPQEAEIKRLQSWLLKCGIRKLWHRELASYDSPKAKINHLKRMLQDVGLEGRYSVEKANRIKEARELKAEVEAIQASAKRWGDEPQRDENQGESDDDDDEKAVLKPLLARRRRGYAFLDSDDGDESD
jgi:hypothetical protein